MLQKKRSKCKSKIQMKNGLDSKIPLTFPHLPCELLQLSTLPV